MDGNEKAVLSLIVISILYDRV